MSWTDSSELKAQLMRLWDRGEILRDAVNGQIRFPLRLSLKTPNSTDITNQFDAVRNWAAKLAELKWARIEWETQHHRIQGTQRLPVCVWIDSLEDAIAWLGKRNEWNQFVAQVNLTRQSEPLLLVWMERYPLKALALNSLWSRLLAVVEWLKKNPRPGIYMRQVDVPGLDSKFIEAHRSNLIELLDCVLPADAVETNKTGLGQFAARYGFLEKPTRIRFRSLDPEIKIIPGAVTADLTLDADTFRHLNLNVKRVFITENEINFLVFPMMVHSIVIFGAGYGWDALAQSHWLNHCTIHYWGDIDTHGFGILDQLRKHFEHVDSFLMDRSTFMAHSAFWGTEKKQLQADLKRLTSAELALFEDLHFNRMGVQLRLEQEQIGFNWLYDYLKMLQ